MATGPGLAMKMTADTVGISRGVTRTEKLLGNLSKSTRQATFAMRGLVAIEVGKLLAGGFTRAANAISGYVSSIRSSVDETAKLAAQTGIAVEALQVFQLAAQMSGVDNLVEPIRKLGIEIGNAAQSGNIEKFERLGLNFDQLSRMAPEEQFKQIAAAIAALPTPAERAAAAVAIFGEQGVKMLPLFEQNLAAIEERMKRLGIVLTEDQTGAIEEMNDSLLLVQKTFEGIIGQVTANLAPVVSALAEDFLSFIESYQGLGDGTGGTALADSITEALFDGAEVLAGMFDYVVAQLNDWGVTFSGTVEALAAVFDIFGRVAAFIEAVFLGYRSFLMEYFALIASAFEKIISLFSSSAAEFLNNFAAELRRNAAEDRAGAIDAADRAFGEGERAAPGTGPATGWVNEGRARWEGRNSPEAVAEREARAAEREAKRQAAAEARAQAQRQKEEEKRRQEELKMIEDYNKKVLDAENKYTQARLGYETDRLESLDAVNQKALEQSDIRSGGISQVLAMATGREDPAVTEARKQLKELQAMREDLRALKTAPIEIVGAA
jgi:hypothetical protein